MKNKLLLASSALLMTACSTITSGTTQPLTVLTPNVENAECTLVDTKKGTWRIQQTPQTVEVRKGDGPMTITCEKAGYKTTEYIMKESFAGATLGNVILGGGIGIIVDAASGAAQEYPDVIEIWMEPNSFANAAAKEKWIAERDAYMASLVPQNMQQKEAQPKSSGNFNKN